jgi:hypothetical protein
MSQPEAAPRPSAPRDWAVVILICLLVLGWGLLIFSTVKDPPRRWHLGALPDAPSQSVYSTAEPPATANPPRQVPPLPEAQPGKADGGGG